MDLWIEQGLVSLKEIEEFEELSKPTRQQVKKGENKDAEYQRIIAESGHYKGIPAMDF